MKTIEELIHERLQEQSQDKNINPALLKKEKEILEDVFLNGKSMGKSIGISEEMIRFMYNEGCRLYSAGKYKEASQCFHLLVMLDGNFARYSFGAAACHHLLKEYEEAFSLYFNAAQLDQEDPLPFYHMFDCLMALDDPEFASVMLMTAIDRMKKDPKYSQLQVKAELSLKGLEESLKKDNA